VRAFSEITDTGSVIDPTSTRFATRPTWAKPLAKNATVCNNGMVQLLSTSETMTVESQSAALKGKSYN
jgi:hypothetical protein